RGGNVGAEGVAELDRGGADAAARAVDQQPLAAAQLRLADDRVVGGEEDLREAARLAPPEEVGDRHQLALVDDRVLGLRGAGDDRHHPRARLEARHRGGRGDDFAGQLHAGDVAGDAGLGRRRVEARDLDRVGAVQPRRADPDQRLSQAGLKVVPGPGADRFVLDLGDAHRAILANGDVVCRVGVLAPRSPGKARNMEYRQLGRSGLRVSTLTLGTMTFGGAGKFAAVGSTDVEGARRQIDICLDRGVNLIDTANVYSAGLAEEILGEALE